LRALSFNVGNDGEQDDLGSVFGGAAVLRANRYDAALAGTEVERPVPELHREVAAPNDRGLRGALVTIPPPFATAGDPDQPDGDAVELSRALPLALSGQATELRREIEATTAHHIPPKRAPSPPFAAASDFLWSEG
jgi:hypothetical protein